MWCGVWCGVWQRGAFCAAVRDAAAVRVPRLTLTLTLALTLTCDVLDVEALELGLCQAHPVATAHDVALVDHRVAAQGHLEGTSQAAQQ